MSKDGSYVLVLHVMALDSMTHSEVQNAEPVMELVKKDINPVK